MANHGVGAPPAVRAATDEYLATEDAIGLWIDEQCEIGEVARATTGELFKDWKPWAEAAGEHVGSQRRFSEAIQSRGFDRWREPGTGRMGFKGIARRVGV